MAQTLPDIELTTEWQSINTLSGIPVGTEFVFQHKGRFHKVLLSEGTQPEADSKQGVMLSVVDRTINIAAGSLEIWGKNLASNSTAHVQVV